MVCRHQHQFEFAVQHDAAGDRRYARARLRPYRQYFVDQWPKGADGSDGLCGLEGRRYWLHKSLAQENAKKGITVNVIAPGYIATEMVKAVPKEVLEKNILPHIPTGRLGEVEEIARCVLFLVSEEAGFITGSTLKHQRRSADALTATKISAIFSKNQFPLFRIVLFRIVFGGSLFFRRLHLQHLTAAIHAGLQVDVMWAAQLAGNSCPRHRLAPSAHRPSGGSRASSGRFFASEQPFQLQK